MARSEAGRDGGGPAGARHEIKYVLAASDRPEVDALVRVHPAGFRTAHPDRWVNNVYFDDARYGSVEDHLAGIADRAKLRLRWYGDDRRPPSARLELKEKHGHLGSKRGLEVAVDLDLERIDASALVAGLRRQPLGDLRPWLDAKPFAVLFNRYRRAYRTTADGAVRLTIDSELSFRDGLGSAGRVLDTARRDPSLVIELKAPAERWTELTEVARWFPFRWTAFSKYGGAVMTAAMG